MAPIITEPPHDRGIADRQAACMILENRLAIPARRLVCQNPLQPFCLPDFLATS
jgi:hypothetical protein